MQADPELDVPPVLVAVARPAAPVPALRHQQPEPGENLEEVVNMSACSLQPETVILIQLHANFAHNIGYFAPVCILMILSRWQCYLRQSPELLHHRNFVVTFQR